MTLSRRRQLAALYRFHKREMERARREWVQEIKSERISAPLYRTKKEKG